MVIITKAVIMGRSHCIPYSSKTAAPIKDTWRVTSHRQTSTTVSSDSVRGLPVLVQHHLTQWIYLKSMSISQPAMHGDKITHIHVPQDITNVTTTWSVHIWTHNTYTSIYDMTGELDEHEAWCAAQVLSCVIFTSVQNLKNVMWHCAVFLCTGNAMQHHCSDGGVEFYTLTLC